VPEVQVAGRLERLDWALTWDAEPIPTSLNWTVPVFNGVSTAIQYLAPAATGVGVTVTEFQAPFTVLLRIPDVNKLPGLLLEVFVYKPTITWVAVLFESM
jgi:hypothetical protein